jgi:hypothetical protein
MMSKSKMYHVPRKMSCIFKKISTGTAWPKYSVFVGVSLREDYDTYKSFQKILDMHVMYSVRLQKYIFWKKLFLAIPEYDVLIFGHMNYMRVLKESTVRRTLDTYKNFRF